MVLCFALRTCDLVLCSVLISFMFVWYYMYLVICILMYVGSSICV